MKDYTVRIAGEGDMAYINELRDFALRLGVNDIISFEGGVYGNRKWELFRQADLLYYLHTARILVLWWQRHWLVVHL